MQRYIEFILKRPIPVLLAIAAITVLLGSGIPRLKFDNSIDVMMPKKDSEYLFYKKIIDIYGNIGKFIIIDTTSKNVWKPGFFIELDNLVTDIEEYKEYDGEREEERLKRFNEFTTRNAVTRRDLIAEFGDDPPFQRAISRKTEDILDHAGTIRPRRIKELSRDLVKSTRLKEKAYVDAVLSVITGKDISGKNDTLSAVDLIEVDESGRRILPKSRADFGTLKKRIEANPAFDGALYARDPGTGEISSFGVHIKLTRASDTGEIAYEIWDIARSYPRLHVTTQGIPIVNKFMNDYMRNDLETFLPIVLVVIIIIFFFNFRTLRGVVLPFSTLVLADIWIMGLMGYLGFNINMISVSLPTLMIAVGSSYSIHILNRYYLDRDRIAVLGKEKGLMVSISHIMTTVMLAAITTFFGFISLVTNQVQGIREWGIASAIGVIFSVFIAMTMIPAVLELIPDPQQGKGGGTIPGFLRRLSPVDTVIRCLSTLVIRHHRAVIAVFLLVLIISIAGLARIQVETSVLSYFRKDDYIRTSAVTIKEKYGGAFGMNILIDSGEDNGVKDPAFLKEIDAIREWLVSTDRKDIHITRTDAVTDLVKSMHKAMHNDRKEFYRIPEKRETIMEYFEIYSGDDDDFDGRIDEFEAYFDPAYRTAMVFAKIGSDESGLIGTRELAEINRKVEDYLRTALPKPYTFRITGEPKIIIALSNYVVMGQLLSVLFSLSCVILIVIMLYRNLRAGLVSIIPISTAVIANFGIMGWFGISLDSATAIIASITIGIGIDDTIHFLNSYRHYRGITADTDDAIARTLSLSGRAIIYTSIALLAGFSVLIFSRFKPVALFGLLVAVTMVFTTMGALTGLPSVIRASRINLEPGRSRIWKYLDIGRFFTIDDEK
ncbi:MAG: MMPL family transporter [Spirochaetes bacterium]|nr:MMPL family transporter [Spirochaetota bacterium]